jgi:heme-degrading monooxygenase HmoA
VTRISLFEVAAEEEGGFVAAWGAPDALLLRALRDDVEFRFVAVGERASPAASASPAAGASPAATALYEVAREDGTPDVSGGVVLVNPFEVPGGDDERFLTGWDAARAVLAEQQGYLGTRLHRSAEPARFRFVNMARWSSPLMFARALQRPEFAAAARAIPFPSHPALYQPAGG